METKIGSDVTSVPALNTECHIKNKGKNDPSLYSLPAQHSRVRKAFD